MGSRRIKQTHTLEQRLSDEAKRLREEAKGMPRGAARDAMIRKARQTEIASHLNDWLQSPGLVPPK